MAQWDYFWFRWLSKIALSVSPCVGRSINFTEISVRGFRRIWWQNSGGSQCQSRLTVFGSFLGRFAHIACMNNHHHPRLIWMLHQLVIAPCPWPTQPFQLYALRYHYGVRRSNVIITVTGKKGALALTEGSSNQSYCHWKVNTPRALSLSLG
jgi:hypothetical protein